MRNYIRVILSLFVVALAPFAYADDDLLDIRADAELPYETINGPITSIPAVVSGWGKYSVHDNTTTPMVKAKYKGYVSCVVWGFSEGAAGEKVRKRAGGYGIQSRASSEYGVLRIDGCSVESRLGGAPIYPGGFSVHGKVKFEVEGLQAVDAACGGLRGCKIPELTNGVNNGFYPPPSGGGAGLPTTYSFEEYEAKGAYEGGKSATGEELEREVELELENGTIELCGLGKEFVKAGLSKVGRPNRGVIIIPRFCRGAVPFR